MAKNSTVELFKAIDFIFKIPQNACNLIRNGDKITVQKDVCYYSEHGDSCIADIYSMPSTAPRSAMLYIHGGGFVAGGKQYREGVSRWFAGEGFCVFNVDYGLCPQYRFPAPLEHLVYALNFIVENAQKYNVNADKVVIAGDSAGGYYASMLATLTCNLTARKLVKTTPKASVGALLLNCGLYDVEMALKNKKTIGEKIFTEFTGMDNFDEYEFKELCSPINLLSANFPPTFMIYSKHDLFCGGQAERMITKMHEQGIYAEVYASTTLIDNHIFSLAWRTPQAKRANLACLDFVSRYLKGEIPPRS